jgi:hypothetical protein
MASNERVRLESDVVQAALAKRRLHLAMVRHCQASRFTEWEKAHDAYVVAVDALLAYMGEGGDGR